MFKRTLIALVVAGSLLTPLAAGVTSADSSNSNSPTWFCTKVVDADSGLIQIGRADNGKEKAALEKQGYECTKSQQSALWPRGLFTPSYACRRTSIARLPVQVTCLTHREDCSVRL